MRYLISILLFFNSLSIANTICSLQIPESTFELEKQIEVGINISVIECLKNNINDPHAEYILAVLYFTGVEGNGNKKLALGHLQSSALKKKAAIG